MSLVGVSPQHVSGDDLAQSLFQHGKITTTGAPFAEKLITHAKRGDLHGCRGLEGHP